MPIADVCSRNVACINRNAKVTEAAKLMRENHVGDVIVCDGPVEGHNAAHNHGQSNSQPNGHNNGRHHKNGHPQAFGRPVGILTDRDIVVGLVAMGIAPDTIIVDDVMTPALVTVTEDQGIYETIQLMERYGVSRLPVVNAEGVLCGIVSSTDLLDLLSREIGSLSRLSERQKHREREVRL